MPKFTRALSISCLVVAAASLAPQMAAAQTVTLDPGLYDYSHDVSMQGHVVKTDSYEYCVREGQNSKTMDEIAASLVEDGDCKISNINMTSSTASADISCKDPDFGLDVKGRFEATYGSDYYNINSNAVIGGFQKINVKATVRRRSECPANWNNPDDVRPD